MFGLWSCSAVIAAGAVLALEGAEPAARAPVHKIAVDLRGPLAMVQVTRSLPSLQPVSNSDEGDGGEVLLDLALPQRAALVDVEVNDGERWRAAEGTDAARARGLYVEGLRARGLSFKEEPIDDGATHRIRLAHKTDARQRPITIRYRFSAVTDYSEGRYRLRFPASPELTPIAADVALTATGVADVEISGVRTNKARSPARGAWEISYTMGAAAPARDDGAAPALAGSAAIARLSERESAMAVAIHARSGGSARLPETVLFLIDRSRSVGLPGLAAERDVARRLLEVLPPATRFDVLFFDRTVKRLYTTPRPATREAIAGIDGEMVPDRLVNGTDLAAALRAAGELLRHESAAFAPRTLLVIITDGALPEDQTGSGAALDRALGPTNGAALDVAALVVRAPEDDNVSPAAEQALRALAEARGGLQRHILSSDIPDAVNGVIAGLTHGGDMFSVRLVAGGQRKLIAEAMAPSTGVSGVASFSWAARPARVLDLQAALRGNVRSLSVHPLTVDAAWMRPLVQSANGPGSRLVSTTTLTALVEAAPAHAAEPPAPEPVRGNMDRGVVRNTLSLAFMPRARACYQNRSGATPASRELSGRVRLAIDLVRGEVVAARVESSTLSQPQIESCLCEGAFALEVPRAYRNDAPVTAILNMVFRPRTPEKKTTAEDNFPIGHEIDLILEEMHRSAPPADK